MISIKSYGETLLGTRQVFFTLLKSESELYCSEYITNQFNFIPQQNPFESIAQIIELINANIAIIIDTV